MKVSARVSLDGTRFGRWTIVSDAPDREMIRKGVTKRYRVLVAKCDCGTVRSVVANHLLNGGSTSCGCYRKERASNLVKQRLDRGKQNRAAR